jgi:hypothetical protein
LPSVGNQRRYPLQPHCTHAIKIFNSKKVAVLLFSGNSIPMFQ